MIHGKAVDVMSTIFVPSGQQEQPLNHLTLVSVIRMSFCSVLRLSNHGVTGIYQRRRNIRNIRLHLTKPQVLMPFGFPLIPKL